MRKKIKYSIISLSLLAFTGCSNLSKEINIDQVEYSKPTINYDDFELALIKQSNKAEKHWQEYTSLLTQRQELENSKLLDHAPSGMGAVITMEYQGYLGNFIKLIGDKSGYVVEFQNLTVNDTPIVSVKQYRSTIYDILKSTIGLYDYDVKILESEKRIIVSSKV